MSPEQRKKEMARRVAKRAKAKKPKRKAKASVRKPYSARKNSWTALVKDFFSKHQTGKIRYADILATIPKSRHEAAERNIPVALSYLAGKKYLHRLDKGLYQLNKKAKLELVKTPSAA